MKLTKNQKSVLEIIKAIPARHRVNGRAGGWIPACRLVHLDGRTLNSLFQRGLLVSSEHGINTRGDS